MATPQQAAAEAWKFTTQNEGDRFPWRNGMLFASRGRQELHLLRIEGEKVTSDTTLFQGFGRIRDVVMGPEGYPYVVVNNPNGVIYRLVTALR